MLRTYLYIPENLKDKIDHTAKDQNKSKAEIIRQALKEGLDNMDKKQLGGAKILLKLAETAKSYNVKGPKDASVNHDYYLWGLPKRSKRIKP